jgi:hypothetical protein
MSGGSCGGLFVGGPNAINTADQALVDLIQSIGYPVTYLTDGAVTPTSYIGYGFAYVSDSCSHPALGTNCLNWPIGIMFQTPNAYNSMNLTDIPGVSNGSQTQVRITPAGALHPSTAGHPAGVLTTSSSAAAYNSSATGSLFGSGVVLIAERVSNSLRNTIFAYETGSSMYTGFIAPARRICTHYRGSASIVSDLTAAGIDIFAASMRWIAKDATRDCAGVCRGPSIFDCAGVCYDPTGVSQPPHCADCDGVCRVCCTGGAYPDCGGTCKVCIQSSNKMRNDAIMVSQKPPMKIICVANFPLKLKPLNSRRKK